MKTPFVSANLGRKLAVMTGLLLAGAVHCQAGYWTAYYLNASSYSCAEGGSISGTVWRESFYQSGSGGDWNLSATVTAGLSISSSGQTYPINSSDVTGGGSYNITIPAGSYSANFTIYFNNNTTPEYDRTGTLNVNGLVDSSKTQSAALTLYDNDSTVGVGVNIGGTNYYASSYDILEGGTGGANTVTLSFFRNVAPQARTINYTLSGSTATGGTDYTPVMGTVTIPSGAYYTTVTIAANNASQNTDKTLAVTLTSGNYQIDANGPSTTVNILAEQVGVAIYSGGYYYTNASLLANGTGGANTTTLRFFRDRSNYEARTVNYTLSGSTAIAGTDYTPTLGTITIPAGSDHVDVTIAANNAAQSTTKTLKVSLSSGGYKYYPGFSSSTVTITPDYPNVGVYFTTATMTRGETTSSLVFYRDTYYTAGAAKTINYSLSGSTATGGTDYTPTLTGSVVIPAGQGSVTTTLTPGTSLAATKVLTTTLTGGNYTINSAANTASLGILADVPVINVTAASPSQYAYQNGPAGQFTLIRSGELNKAVTVNYAIAGTATSGVNYTALPASVTFAVNQTSTNLTVTPTSSPTLTGAATVILSLNTNANYFLGANAQAVVTLLPNSDTTNSVASPAGRYWRGSGSDPTYWSQVVPLEGETGTVYDNLYGNAATLYGIGAWGGTYYHYNATNSLSQTTNANRIAFNNPIVACGERVGGTPLYLNQSYSFGVYAGDPMPVSAPIQIMVFNRADFTVAGYINLYPPNSASTNSWNNYLTNGFQVSASTNYLADGVTGTTNTFGLTTTLSDSPDLSWGTTSKGAYMLTHTASAQATNYYYLVEAFGYLDAQGMPMVQNGGNLTAASELYTLEFEQLPAWRSVFLDQPHFDGAPLPPFYAGKTLAEMLTNTPPVTNIVNFTPSAATNLDASPELRRHPTLDNFVASMGNDPIALANYVINNIDLTDPMDYSDNGNVAEQSINPGGVSRGALGTFMEKQGSPVDQCALLVYLLRQAGVPAVYEFPPRNGLQILDARLSRMLKFQVHGGYTEAGQLYTTNTMIPVNYPWVAAYIGTNWVHIFPWLKDYQIVEGLNLYDEMPTNYSSAANWVHDYVFGSTNLLSLAVDGDNTPRVIFPKFLQQTLRQNHPGISVDDIGVNVFNRQHYYARWQDFPTPTWVTNVSTPLESLTSSAITNISPTLTNIFDTVSVEIYSSTDPTKDIQTGDLRLVDLHNREFYIYQTATNSTQILLNLVLLPFRTNITTQFAFTNDASLLSKEVLPLTLDQYDDQLNVRFKYYRHRALSAAYAIDPKLAFLGLTADRQEIMERPLRKGDQAAICMSYGNVTRDMLSVHATDLWQMETALRLNPTLTNSVSPDVYEGATMYLAGMSYYEKVAEFDQLNQHLHKINNLTFFAAGLSKIGPARDTSGNLTNNTVYPVLPNVDMFFYEVASVGNGTLRPDSGQNDELANHNYNLIAIADGSAEEHQVINTYYQQTNAVSTVRLLQLAQSTGAGIVSLNINNYAAKGATVYQGKSLQSWDSNLWSQVVAAFQNPADASYCTAYITPGPMTNSAYKGMGALVLGWSKWQALISPQTLNGAYGQPFSSLTAISPPNTLNYSLNNDDGFNISFYPPASGTTLTPPVSADFNFQNDFNQRLNNIIVSSGFDQIENNQIASTYNLPTATTPQNNAADFAASKQSGFFSKTGDMISQLWSSAADPVQTVTGEFYIDETDLSLPGPLPLALRRNYSSQNLADNQFGTGWKFSIMPYLSVTAGATNIYAADMDGAVLAYAQTATNASVWLPSLAANPQLNNNTTAGAGGLVNRLRDRIVQSVNGSTTNYTLFGADGSTRIFQVMTFNNGVLNQTRPYLQTWTDSRGNYYTFTFGTNSTQPNFGEVTRIQCSNGNYLGFDYDIYSHIVDAYCGDGRRLNYEYDQYGDLVTVTLPDETTRSYVYQHASQAVTNGSAYYSTHLITEEDKPDGRVLQNFYDSQRRVTNQLSTAGVDLTPVRVASFIFSNNYALTNSFTNAITGYTLIVDGNGNTNRYDYTNSLITKITDPLNQTVQQTWYADNATAPGYPRSVATRTDKRGLVTQYQYDSNGNVTNTVVTGDLTGDGITTQTATNTAVYNANNLPTQMTDAAGNSVVTVYDPVFNFLPQQTIRYAGATPVSTNYTVYGNATNVVVNGNVTQTNMAFGLPIRQIRAYGSADAAMTDLAYDGHGFLTQSVRYTGTADPNVTNTFFYNERGQMVNQIDALGAVKFFDYDALNRPIEQEAFDENGNALSWNFNYYNDNGELSWTDGPRFNPEDYVFFDYDGEGRRSTEIHWRSEARQDGTGVEAPAGYNLYAQAFYQYDLLGNLTRSVDPRGAITTNTWDALSRLAQRKHLDTDGITVLSVESFGYEPGGQVQSYTNALGGVTTTLYTITGQPEYRSNPDGSTNGWRYYLDGRIEQEIQGNGAFWLTTYDDVNRVTTRAFYSAAGVLEATTSTQLDRRGNVIQKVDAGNNVFTTSFDDLDRPKVSAGPAIVTVSQYTGSGFDPGNTNVTYVTNLLQQVSTNFYDAANRTLTSANALGESTVTTMDALGRTTSAKIYGATGGLVREKYFTYSTDHNAITVTDGSGASAISHTTYTDNDGHTVLSVAYPLANALDFTRQTYDLAGNTLSSEHDVSYNGTLYGYTLSSYSFDGLNRVTQKVDRDNAVTTYGYDSLNDLTNRTMPGGLQWQAAFNNAGQVTHEQNYGGGYVTRATTYTYYPSGSPSAGLLDTKTDGRGLVSTYSYDDFLRQVSITRTASLYNHVDTFLGYDARGFATNITEQNTGYGNNNPKVVSRTFDAYGQLSSETVAWNGANLSSASQSWDAAGRRTGLGINGANYNFASRADGALTYAANPTGSGGYAFDTAGLLTTRTVGNRSTTITSRDGEGQPYYIVTTVNGVTQLAESLTRYLDGLLADDTLYRADFTDSRSYDYADFSRRLISEQQNLNATTTWTNTLAYDGGVAGGIGALTKSGGTSSTSSQWNGGVSPLSRVNTETNTSINYPAYGRVNGQSTLTVLLDGQPLSVITNASGDPSAPYKWRTMMELTPGAHQLKVAALHPSGFYTAWATNTFTNNLANQSAAIGRDSDGNITQRTWKAPDGSVLRQQQLWWDAKDRLVEMAEGDGTMTGFFLHVEYDGLDRRLLTRTYPMVNGVIDYSVTPTIIYQYYDPMVEFLELGVSYGAKTEWKLYGPDLNDVYGGMNGTGGFDGVSSYLNTFNPVISDYRGNILGVVTNGVVSWNPARPTGYGAVPGYRPAALGNGVSISLASAWRGRWMDVSGYYQIGKRLYDPIAGMWLSYDSAWNDRDPNYLTFCGGDPINGFDSDGRCVKAVGNEVQTDWNALPAFAMNVGNNVEQGNNDFWYGVFTAGGQTINAVEHPIDTTASIINGASTFAANLYDNPSGTAQNVYNGLAANFSDPSRASQFIGSFTFGAETTIAGGAAFNAVNKAVTYDGVSSLFSGTADNDGWVSQLEQQQQVGPAPKGGANANTQAAASQGSSYHADQPGMLPDQLRNTYLETEFEFTKPGVAGQDVQVVGGMHPSAYPGSDWPEGVNYGDFKPDTASGAKTFRSDQRNKWSQPTTMLPYNPASGTLK